MVWTLNFYLIEMTSRYVTECNLITNTIIAANNVLKRTTNVILYSCIVHGLERIVLTNTMTQFCHDKVERLALDLVKMENEQFSLLALKLLATCMYMGTVYICVCDFVYKLSSISGTIFEPKNNRPTKLPHNRLNRTAGEHRAIQRHHTRRARRYCPVDGENRDPIQSHQIGDTAGGRSVWQHFGAAHP